MSNSATPDKDVAEVMDMVLGDYFEVFTKSLEDQMIRGEISTGEEMARFIRFSKGCRKICEAFGLDADKLDVDNLLAPEMICNHFKEELDAGREDNC